MDIPNNSDYFVFPNTDVGHPFDKDLSVFKKNKPINT